MYCKVGTTRIEEENRGVEEEGKRRDPRLLNLLTRSRCLYPENSAKLSFHYSFSKLNDKKPY